MKKIIQITSGKGPAECCWVVARVLKYLLEEAKAKDYQCTILNREEGTENGTLVSATIQVTGEGLDEFLKTWVGTIQWVGQSKFRKFHKRKNWFIAINELQAPSLTKSIDESEIQYEATRAGGPGGQHVNKVSTAIRAVHKPSGKWVLASDNRSQLQNKKMARQRLLDVLNASSLEDYKDKVKNEWQNHQDLQRGNPIRTFRGSDFKANHVRKKYKSERQSNKRKWQRVSEDE